MTKPLLEQIFDRVSEIDLLAYFLKVPASAIADCIKYNSKIRNPFRIDVNPSLGFKVVSIGKRNKILARDFANSRYRGDCIDIAGLVLNKNPNKKNEFIDICTIILTEVIDHISTSRIIINEDDYRLIEIVPTFREWEQLDINYWRQYRLPVSYLENNGVVPIETAYLIKNGTNTTVYNYKRNDPAYCYDIGIIGETVLYKIYFPKRDKHKANRFITNNKFGLECIHEIKPADTFILTKSRKDTLALNFHIKGAALRGASLPTGKLFFISTSSESVYLSSYEINLITSNCNQAYTFFDFDYQGITFANYYKNNYGFKPIFLTNGRFNTHDYKAKDISDLIKLIGVTNTKSIIYEKSSCFK